MKQISMKQISVVVTPETKDRWKKEACALGYMNFTQFIKDAIEEKITQKKRMSQSIKELFLWN